MREIYRDGFLMMTVDDAAGVIRRARTDRPFPTVEDADAAYGAVIRALDRLERGRYGMLVDTRLAPARNDPAFEQVIGRHQVGLFRGFRRIAFLTKTEVGRLQVLRLFPTGPDLPPFRAFLEEQPALAWLSERHDSVPPLSERKTAPPPSRRGP